ncbi:MAG: hypothetical protein AAF399_12385 [Bacteroidota bacterium]
MNRLRLMGCGLLLLLSTQISLSQIPALGEASPRIDGTWEAWPAPQPLDREGVEYALQSGDTTLFIGMRISDQQLQQQILLCGLTLWVGKKPKIPHGKGIGFPVGTPEELRPQDSQRFLWVIRELEGKMNQEVGNVEGMELVNIYGGGEKTWGSHQRESGLRAAIGRDKNERMVIEWAIPLVLIEDKMDKKGRFDLWWQTGKLGRPKDVYGGDAVGLSGGALSNPDRVGGETLRMIQARQDRYREFASRKEFRLRKLFVPKIE